MASIKKTSREYFLEAARELLNVRPISEITVDELTRLVGVSRTTFYKNFSDKQELVEQVFVSELVDTFFFNPATMYEREVCILRRIDESRQFYRNALKSEEFITAWMDYAYRSDYEYLRFKLEGRNIDEATLRSGAYLITQTLAGGTLDWARHKPNSAPEDYARMLTTYCEGGLAAYLGQTVDSF